MNIADKKTIILGTGVPRSGTTWLYSNLAAHPDIHIPYKSIHFFDSTFIYKKTETNYHLGEDWYLSRFKPSGEKLCADVCPSYFMDPEAPERIRKFNPDIKIILTFRNPYEAVQSHYWQFQKTWKLKDSFLEVIRKNENNFLESNLLHRNLMRYLKYFSEDQILYCIYDDLKKNPAAYLKRIYSFLGVDEEFIPETRDKKVNQRRRVKSPFLRDIQSALTEFVRSKPRLYKAVNNV